MATFQGKVLQGQKRTCKSTFSQAKSGEKHTSPFMGDSGQGPARFGSLLGTLGPKLDFLCKHNGILKQHLFHKYENIFVNHRYLATQKRKMLLLGKNYLVNSDSDNLQPFNHMHTTSAERNTQFKSNPQMALTT